MADKSLAPGAWNAFAKGKGYKDKDLVSALEALARAEKGGPMAELEALAALDKPLEALRKAHKGDKALAGELDKIEQAAQKRRREVEKEAADADEDENSPAQLTTKLAPLLRQVRKGDTMQALIGVGTKQAAVMLSRRSIGNGPQSLLKNYLDGGSVKFVRGQCVFEANAHTFVVEGQAAGLAKKLKAALLQQTEMRLKVRVRGQDPNDVDEDMDDAEGDPTGDAPGTQASPQQLEWERRSAEAGPQVLQALKNPKLDASRLRAVWGFAQQKAEVGDHAAALKALDMLAGLMKPGQTTPQPQGQPQPRPQTPQDDGVDKALAVWRQRRDEAVEFLRSLARELVGYQLPNTDKALIEVNAVFKQLGGELRTEQQVTEMEVWLRDDTVVAEVCALEDVDLRAPLLDALQDVRTAFAHTA